MSAWTSVHLGQGNVAPSLSGTELSGSRRQIDLSDVQYARLAYAGGGLLGDAAVGSAYSVNGGASWQPLIPPGPALSTSNYIFNTTWIDLNVTVGPMNDVWVNAMIYGAALLGGLTYGIQFVELQLR